MSLHGTLTHDRHARLCDAHGSHAPLYICWAYPRALRKELKSKVEAFRARVSNPDWIEQQTERETEPWVIETLRRFAGL